MSTITNIELWVMITRVALGIATVSFVVLIALGIIAWRMCIWTLTTKEQS